MPTSPSSVPTGENLRPDIAGALQLFDLEADQNGFVGLAIAPPMEVALAADTYGVIPLAELLKDRDSERNSDGTYNSGQGKATFDSYVCQEHGYEERVDRREAVRYGNYWNAELLAAQRTRDVVLRNHNKRVIALALGIANTTAAGTLWSTTATCDPVKNVRDAQIAIRNRTGLIANAMVCDWEAFQCLRDSDTLIGRLKYDGYHNVEKGNLDADMVARALGLEYLRVSGSLKNNANENAAASLATMWDKTQALVYVRNDGLDLMKPQFMRTFHWGADGSAIGGVFEQYYSAERRGDVIRQRMDTAEKVVYSSCAQRLTGVL